MEKQQTKISPDNEIVFNETVWHIAEKPDSGKVLGEIVFNHHLKTISRLSFNQTRLLCGLYENDLLFYVFIPRHIDEFKEFTVWLDYPLGEHVKAIISPPVRKSIEGNESTVIPYIGYLIWQIARVYDDIYQNHFDDLKVWGHYFDDLYLRRIRIYKDNVFELFIST